MSEQIVKEVRDENGVLVEKHIHVKEKDPESKEDGAMLDLLGHIPAENTHNQQQDDNESNGSGVQLSDNPKYNDSVPGKVDAQPSAATDKKVKATDLAHHNKNDDENRIAPSLTLASNLTILFSTFHWLAVVLYIASAIGFQVLFDKNQGVNNAGYWIDVASKGLYYTMVPLFWIGAVVALIGGFFSCFAGGNAMKNWSKIPIIVFSFAGSAVILVGDVILLVAFILFLVISKGWKTSSTGAINSLGSFFEVIGIIHIILLCVASFPLVIFLAFQGVKAIQALRFEKNLEKERESYAKQL